MSQVAMQLRPEGHAAVDVQAEMDRLMARSIVFANGSPVASCLEHYARLARMYLKAGVVPDTHTRNRDEEQRISCVMVILMAADAIKMPHIQALAFMQVINNRVALWGDALPGLVRSSGKCHELTDVWEGTGDEMRCISTGGRYRTDKTVETCVRTFSVADAKKAGLWGKSGPWSNMPKRMLQMRARAFVVRDLWPDVLLGMGVVEELQDNETTEAATVESEAKNALEIMRARAAAPPAPIAPGWVAPAAPPPPEPPAPVEPPPAPKPEPKPRKSKGDANAEPTLEDLKASAEPPPWTDGK